MAVRAVLVVPLVFYPGGLKILVLAWLVSGVFIAWASAIEVRMLLGG